MQGATMGTLVSGTSQKNLFAGEDFPLDPTPWELAAEADQLAAQVVFNKPLDVPFSYLVPDPLRDMLVPGQRVRVPFGRGNRPTVGFCVGVGPVPQTQRALKTIESVLDREPLLSPMMLELTRWIADRYLCSWGQVLDTVVPAGVKKNSGTRVVQVFELTEAGRARLESKEKLPAKQQAVMDALRGATRPMRGEDLAEAAGCGTAPIDGVRKKGWIRVLRERSAVAEPEQLEVETQSDLKLNSDQLRALQAVVSTLRKGEHKTFLLHGVTGSGKTEVYIQAIREIVSYGRQAIVLVPEISLTPQTIRRFRSRFPSVAVLHSHLSDAERHWQWQQIARGEVQVVVGARSAVFAPTPHLGLIIIDEEHETSFKQDTAPRYHAREVARQRAMMEKIPLVLGSATPTLESWARVQRKQDELISLPKRVESRPLPPVIIIDVRNDIRCSRGAAIGRALENAIRQALSQKGQVILFLNLRGYSPTVWCRTCGEGVKCPHCDITLTWHKDRNIALCHSCDYEHPTLMACPKCGAAGLRYLGIGTQKLEAEVRATFPEARVVRMDSDSMKRPGSHDEALEQFRHGEVDILLGTQMIAKGLDFPNVTLVGVVNADTMLHQPDLRASERTFQLISQVAGRTGRGERGGRVLVQSCCPTDPSIQKAAQHDYRGFVQNEMKHRHEVQAPPFRVFTRIIVRGPKEDDVREFALQMARVMKEAIAQMSLKAVEKAAATAAANPPAEPPRRGTLTIASPKPQAPPSEEVRLLGPAPCPVAKLKDHYRYHFQLSAATLEPIQQLWHEVAPLFPKSEEIEYVVDVDPINMR
ncbi:MAG: primosomal protein N' [Planctomycetaceae bacterium]|nr:primosomal protein N' [Planctomycetaceae bacterium]